MFTKPHRVKKSIPEILLEPPTADQEMYDWGILTAVNLRRNEFGRTLIDVGTAANNIPLKTIGSKGITRQEATHAPISIRGLEGALGNTYGCITLKVNISSTKRLWLHISPTNKVLIQKI